MNDEPLDEYSQEDLDCIFEEAIAAIERLHKALADAAEDAGVARQVIVTSHPRYSSLFSMAEDDPTIYPLVSSGLGFVIGLTIQFDALSDAVDNLSGQLGPVINTTSSFSTSTDSASSIFLPDRPDLEPLPSIPNRGSREQYATILRRLDKSLADSYDEVWQTFYGTAADRFRAALFMMRQVYDHFFAVLAPDDEVRGSLFWTAKSGANPDQIYRSEKIRYAADSYVSDPNTARTLAASAKQINELYQAANRAHKRGTLDPESAEKAVLAMDSMLKDWVDAI